MNLYPAAMALCACILGLTTSVSPGAGTIAAGAAGALLILRHSLLTFGAIIVLLSGLLWVPDLGKSVFYWIDLALLSLAAVLPRRLVPALLNAPRWSWPAAMVIGALCLAATFHIATPGNIPLSLITSACAAFIGAGIARHLGVVDARLLAWGEGGMVEVTRDLLLGRITSGMLHDLAQPLNVISMANANTDYIVSRLAINDEHRRQIQERVARIASHTEGAAHILSLFRWFGRDGRDGNSLLTVRHALDCAIATTRSNVRHFGVSVTMRGNALDEVVPDQYGALQMMAVAALLSAFGSFLGPNDAKRHGEVLLNANVSPAHIVITVECVDEDGQPIPGRPIDEATLWLVQQVAMDAFAEFRCMVRSRQPVRFVIRLGRQDS